MIALNMIGCFMGTVGLFVFVGGLIQTAGAAAIPIGYPSARVNSKFMEIECQ